MTMTYAEQLSREINAFGKITGDSNAVEGLSTRILRDNDESAIRELCTLMARRLNQQPSDSERKIITDLKNALVGFCGHRELSRICRPSQTDGIPRATLSELISQLNSLVGLEKVKAEITQLIEYHQLQQRRKAAGLKVPKRTLHIAFTGNPGTGKTTVARIIGQMYHAIGLLPKGHFIEASRTDLIAGYQGQTALKVKDLIGRALGGVLFIDEAYSITENDHADSYGRECLTELTKALEDHREDLVVIVAGYTAPMNKFFRSNPGLKSRFNSFIAFDNYSPAELISILEHICSADDYILDARARDIIYRHISTGEDVDSAEFANGRYIRNLFEDMTMRQAHRLSSVLSPTCQQLQTLTKDDIPEVLVNEYSEAPLTSPENSLDSKA